CTPSFICSGLAVSTAMAASRLSFTGTRLSAKLSTAYLRALEISSSARRRVFSASALARRKASETSACLASSSARQAARSGAEASPGPVSGVGEGCSLFDMSRFRQVQTSTCGRCPHFQEGFGRKCGMNRRDTFWALAAAVWAGRPAFAAALEFKDELWTDMARSRSLPVRLRWPAGDAPCGLVVYSHGLGGSRAGG